MNDDFKDIATYFEGLANNLKNDLPQDLSRVANDILRELQAGNFKDRTGELRRSMNVSVMDYSIKISMLDYGYFVSFGVQGGDDTSIGLTPETETYFGVQQFKSKKRKNWGITPRRFYPNDIQERILKTLTEENG